MMATTQGTTRRELPAPIGQLLGLTLTGQGPGRATVEFAASERYANPMGTLHGGVLCVTVLMRPWERLMAARSAGATPSQRWNSRSIFSGRCGRQSCAPRPG